MELGQNQMHVFASLVLILGAAFVALICDLLKGKNEQLRELVLELRVRREEEHKRFQMLAPQALTQRVLADATALPEAAQVPSEKVALSEKATEHAGRKPKRITDPHKRAIAPEALAVIQRGVDLAAAPVPVATPVRIAAEDPPTENGNIALVHPETEALASAGQSHIDWSRLLGIRRPAPPPPQRKSNRTSATAEGALPAGFQDGFVLSRLVESRQPVSGLVVSIGTGAVQSGALLPANVRALIQSLLGPNDFAAQSGPDEFLLIYPGERGAQAQRKLSQIAEQLWDFQLRSVATLSIQFSWGGVEVRGETIDEAIASATERMQETRRGRKIFTLEHRTETAAPLRRAV